MIGQCPKFCKPVLFLLEWTVGYAMGEEIREYSPIFTLGLKWEFFSFPMSLQPVGL